MSSISGVGGFRPPPSRPPSFEKLDGDGNGSLSLYEFKSGAPKGVDSSKSEDLFKTIDSDGDGNLTKAESDAFKSEAQKAQQQIQSFLFSLHAQAQQGTGEAGGEVSDVFAQLDANSDGSIARDEFLSALAEKTGSTSAGGQGGDLLQTLFDAIDSDKNGSVSKDEDSAFRQKMDERFETMRQQQATSAYGQSAQLSQAAMPNWARAA